MNIATPRHDADLPIWREAVTASLNGLHDTTSARTTTIDATPVVIMSVPILSGTVALFEWTILARQSAGSGTVGDGAVYVGVVAAHLVGGTATIIGSGATLLTVEDDSSWAASVAGSGNQLQWTITGASGKTIGWRIDVRSRRIAV